MAPYTYPGYHEEEPKREQHCWFGHDYEAPNHWKCRGCGKWMDDCVSHGCTRPEERNKDMKIGNTFLEDKKKRELKLAWKRATRK